MLPPGPRGPKILTTYKCLAKPFEVMPKWLETYGDPFTVDAVNGKVVMTGDPELIREIFRANPEGYEPFAAEGTKPLVGPDSIFLLTGDLHRRERKLLMPPFHGERMRAYAEAMANAAVHHLDAAVDRGVVELQDVTQEISKEVIVRAVFGAQSRERVQRFGEAISEFVDSTNPLFFFMPFLQREFGGMGPWARFRRAFEAFDALLSEQIERARERAEPGDDILSLLLAARYEDGSAMRDEAIRDELRSLLFAGHETTAIALAWAVDQIRRHPEVEARIREEVRGLGRDPEPGEYAKLEVLDAACKESMRLFPIVTEVIRSLNRPMKLGKFEIPEGAAVGASISLVHHDEVLYPDPQRFNPDRFIGRRMDPFTYFPFGGGHRRCAGAAFADFEMRIVLAIALTRYRLELQEPEAAPPVRRNVTMAPKGGVPVRVFRA